MIRHFWLFAIKHDMLCCRNYYCTTYGMSVKKKNRRK